MNRCVNMLAGLDVARAFVLSGRYRRVLLITSDKVADGAPEDQAVLLPPGARCLC